ncbi:MAG: site-specific integrase [Alphaproteobacteria bacterium]|nr:site-specific integrase [Alphaproteobacteria bacterium]
MAAINYAAKELDFKAPRLPSIKYKNKRVRWLTIEQRDKLLNSYNKHAKAPITMLCFQGCRTQEALQLQWNDIDLKRKTIYFAKTKNGEPRTIPMHKKVWWMLARMWIKRQKPFEGHVFLSSRGKPYSDTRETESQGGNPLAKAHNTACSKAGIKNFTPHDWRHHWASWCVMSGIDIETIRNMGGWKSLSMLERYAAVSTTHMEEAINKIK